MLYNILTILTFFNIVANMFYCRLGSIVVDYNYKCCPWVYALEDLLTSTGMDSVNFIITHNRDSCLWPSVSAAAAAAAADRLKPLREIISS